MERLTKRLNNGKELCIDVCGEKCIEGRTWCPKCKPFTNVMKKLAEYEDAEEQGMLLRLPCKVGDVVYTVSSYMECCREECKWVEEECDECCDYQRVYFVKETKFQIQQIAVFGKTVFLTKEEAEQALAKMKEV